MTAICLSQVALECKTGTSDKLYVIQVEQHGAEYVTNGYSGRRGATLITQEKYRGPSLATANVKAVAVEKAKRRSSGYTSLVVPSGSAIVGMPASAPKPGAGSTPASPASTPVPKAPSIAMGPLAMLAQPLNIEEVEPYITSADWCLQRKYDGERVTISVRRCDIQAWNRNGHPRAISQAVQDRLAQLSILPDFSDERETVLDGELLGDVLVVYDALTLRNNDIRKYCYDERYASLEALLDRDADLLAPTAFSENDKRAMLASAAAEQWEGLMWRHLDGEYVSGRSSHLLKSKLWATCTCRVLSVNSQRSIKVGLLDEDGVEAFVGNVTVPVNQDIPELDGLVEVRYLYALEGGSLYQPTLLRVRYDVEEADKRRDLRMAPPEKRGLAGELTLAPEAAVA